MTKTSLTRPGMRRARELIAILRGIVGILLLNAVFVTICILGTPISVFFSYLLTAIGFSQFIYAFPTILWLLSYKRWGIFKGLLIGVGLTALLNATYFLVLVLKR